MEILDYKLFELGGQVIRVSNLVVVFLIMVVARLLVLAVTAVMSRRLSRQGQMDRGRRHAVTTITKYFVYVVALLVALQAIGVNLTVLVAGSTALFVGLGLGLQNTFKDVVGGVILLFEGSLEIDDVVEVNGVVGRVRRIGLRTSTIQTRDDISIIVPNNNFVSENVINWSHQEAHARMRLKVNVAYGSDTELVSRLLITCAKGHPDVGADPAPRVFFQEFGDYSYQFVLLFWTVRTFEAEQTLSDLRFAIEAAFRRNGVVIPYPVTDVRLTRQEPDGAA